MRRFLSCIIKYHRGGKMQDAIFVYKRHNQFKVLGLDKSDHGNALSEDGWKHIATLSASAWVENLLNMTSEDRYFVINDLLDEEG